MTAVTVSIALLLLSAHAAAPATEFFVAPDGNDSWSGRLPAPNAARADGAFRTVDRARDALRALPRVQPPGDVPLAVVNVRAGDYRLDKPIVLGPADSGLPGHPIIYRGYGAERPRLLGTRIVTGLKRWRGGILWADLKPLGFDGLNFRQLFFNGRRQVLARHPNLDPAHPNTAGWLTPEVPREGGGFGFKAREGDLPPWSDLSQAEIFLYHRYNWYNTIVPVTAIDRASRVVSLGGPPYDAIVGGAERYYFQNVLDALDAPGEWYFDYKACTLYFWPPGPIDNAVVEAPVIDPIVQLQPGAEHIVLRGMTVEMSEGSGFDLRDTNDCLIAANIVRNCGIGTQIGGWGSWEDRCGIGIFGGHNNGAVGNDISDTGGHGIKLTGGDRKTLAPAGNLAENNHIHHTGGVWAQGCGARLEGVGNRFSGNLIYDCPRMGIIFSGNDHVIEFNHIHHVNLQTCDTGGIYTGGRDWLNSRGCVVRYNYLHDLGGYGLDNGKWSSPYYAWGIYLDDLTCGVDVIGNIVVGARRGSVMLHNSRDCLVENNVFIDGIERQIECLGWPGGGECQPVFEKNWDELHLLPAWAKYRFFREVDPRGATQMAHNQFLHNIIYYHGATSALYGQSHLPSAQTVADNNLIYHFGQPLLTGAIVGEPRAGAPDVAPNGGFEDGEYGETPPGWKWFVRPTAQAAAVVTDEAPHTGARCLRLDGATAKDDKGNPQWPMLMSADIPIIPGRSYYLSVWMRTDKPDSQAGIVAASYRAGVYWWAVDTLVRPTAEWKQYEMAFKIPGIGEQGYQEAMSDLYLRLDFRAPDGHLFVDDVQFREAAAFDEWTAWRKLGLDVNSVVADPEFVNPERGDYRLKPTSPALKLGFKPIPFERIGPHQDELRASWPIVEDQRSR